MLAANFLRNTNFRGLGWAEIRWAFTTFQLGVYQPFAWLLLEPCGWNGERSFPALYT